MLLLGKVLSSGSYQVMGMGSPDLGILSFANMVYNGGILIWMVSTFYLFTSTKAVQCAL